ncbi:MAG: general secretion pathway protein GspB [Gammaproteobacteria bacterium]
MSLILDALRKSERARQQTLSGQLGASGVSLDVGRVPVPWATLIGLLLIANVIVLGVILWRSRGAEPGPPPVQAPVVSVPAVMPSPAEYRPAVRSLAAEAATVTPVAPVVASAGPVAVPAVLPKSAVASAGVAPAIRATTTTAQVATGEPSAVTQNAAASGGVPLLDTLPLAFQQSFPALHLDVHDYASNPAERFVVINMQRYIQGETLAEGPSVVAIVADGVILEYHGQKFLLPRP